MPAPLRALLGCGYAAVGLFFVLSGFILTYVHASRGDIGLDARRFYVSRFARLYPVYALGVLLVVPIMVVHVAKVGGVRDALASFAEVSTLTQAWFPAHALSWNSPGWSLSVEAFFYLSFPFLGPRVLRCSVRTAVVVAGVAWLACLAPALAYEGLDPDRIGHATPSDEYFWLNALTLGPLPRLPEFVLGIALGRIYLDSRAREAIRARAVPVSIGASLLYVTALSCSSGVPYVLLHNGLLAPLVALIVLSLAADRGPLARLLSTPALVALGDASYAMYILHLPIEMYVLKALGGREAFVRTPLLVVIFLAVVVAVSLACFRWFETPIRNAALAMIRAREPKVAARAASLGT